MPTDAEILAQLKLPQGTSMRPPTGRPSWPVVVLEGRESTGKSWNSVRLSSDQRLGPSLYIPFGEINIDEYGALPGSRFQILDHDGSYRALHGLVTAVTKLPVDLDRPPVLVIDSMSNLWALLSNEADASARRGKNGNPGRPIDEDVTITADKWNTAKRKWRSIMDPLLQWPGLVVLTARGEETLAMDDSGRPAKDERGKVLRTYKIEAHKSLPYDAQVIVRCTAPGQGIVTKAKTLHMIVPPGGLELPEFNLTDFLFEGLQLGANMGSRTFQGETLEEPAPAQAMASADAAKRAVLGFFDGDGAKAKAAWDKAHLPVDEQGRVPVELVEGLLEYLRESAAAASQPAQEPSTPVEAPPAPEDHAPERQEPRTNVADTEPQLPVRQSPEDDPRASGGQYTSEPARPDEALPAAPQPEQETIEIEDPPSDPAATPDGPQEKLAAFLGEVGDAAGNVPELRKLRSRVKDLPAIMRKPASEAVTNAMAACSKEPATS